eukprot:XP_019077057.1 PREDICTED: uncharacterized protein LOC109122984 isoform X2 [Vitis vinifera]
MGLESDGNLINLRIGDEAGLCLLSSQWPEGMILHLFRICHQDGLKEFLVEEFHILSTVWIQPNAAAWICLEYEWLVVLILKYGRNYCCDSTA